MSLKHLFREKYIDTDVLRRTQGIERITSPELWVRLVKACPPGSSCSAGQMMLSRPACVCPFSFVSVIVTPQGFIFHLYGTLHMSQHILCWLRGILLPTGLLPSSCSLPSSCLASTSLSILLERLSVSTFLPCPLSLLSSPSFPRVFRINRMAQMQGLRDLCCACFVVLLTPTFRGLEAR